MKLKTLKSDRSRFHGIRFQAHEKSIAWTAITSAYSSLIAPPLTTYYHKDTKTTFINPEVFGRVYLPYCFKVVTPELVLPLNREYKPLGVLPGSQSVRYQDYIPSHTMVIEDIDASEMMTHVPGFFYLLYTDSNYPWETQAQFGAYLHRLDRAVNPGDPDVWKVEKLTGLKRKYAWIDPPRRDGKLLGEARMRYYPEYAKAYEIERISTKFSCVNE